MENPSQIPVASLADDGERSEPSKTTSFPLSLLRYCRTLRTHPDDFERIVVCLNVASPIDRLCDNQEIAGRSFFK